MTTTTSQRQAGAREGAVLLLGSSLTIVGSVMVTSVIPKMMAEFAPTNPNADLWVPLAITGPALAIALFAPVAGWLADRVGRKPMLVVATLLYAILGALPAQLDALMGVVAARLLFGVAEAMIMTGCSTLIADYWRGEQRMRYVNGQVITIGLVGAIFFAVGGMLGETSWRTPFYLYLLPLLLVPFMLRVLWEPPLERQQASDHERGEDRVNMVALVAGCLLIGVGMVLCFVVTIQTPVVLVGLGVSSSTLIGLGAGWALLASLLGALLWPLARRALGTRGCNVLLLLLLAIGLWMLAEAPDYTTVLLAVTVHGLGAGMLVPNAMAPVMNALTPKTRGRGMGLFTGCLYIGQFVSPLVVDLAAGIGGDLKHATLLLAGLGALYALGWAGATWRGRALLAASRHDRSPS
ncbi:MFS transporter [Chromohalobacter israelensis]|uniref:MFS transporter n=1 Tax=Chromohalobacter israelensis TaxID=141390 RepID=UPI00265B9C0B|nr:MFS transporter [Chromohalobacter salexigens]MDO0947448.1 MFS transporter [Chromohalobacter salexigens]